MFLSSLINDLILSLDTHGDMEVVVKLSDQMTTIATKDIHLKMVYKRKEDNMIYITNG